jgi:hypothetical protein
LCRAPYIKFIAFALMSIGQCATLMNKLDQFFQP